MSEAVLEATGLSKTFRSGERRIEVLRGVDFRIAGGESVSIRGSSGSGKTTLIHLLAGLEARDSGKLLWNGESIGSGRSGFVAQRRATFLGMVFQSFYLIPELNALDNVLMAARIARQPARAAADRAR